MKVFSKNQTAAKVLLSLILIASICLGLSAYLFAQFTTSGTGHSDPTDPSITCDNNLLREVGVSAQQSSSQAQWPIGGVAEKAIDGRRDAIWNHSDQNANSISITDSEVGTQPWWQGNFAGAREVNELNLFFRQDYRTMDVIRIDLLNSSGSAVASISIGQVYLRRDLTWRPNAGVVASAIRITLITPYAVNGYNIMQLAEVEVCGSVPLDSDGDGVPDYLDPNPNAATSYSFANITGNEQSGFIGEQFSQNLSLQLVDQDGNPVAGELVLFDFINDCDGIATPESNQSVNDTVMTDANGYASVPAFAIGSSNCSAYASYSYTDDHGNNRIIYADFNLDILDRNADGDNDGMPDWWENLYGLDKDDPLDNLADPDGDRIPNVYEYMRGQTSPLDENDKPEIDFRVAEDGTGDFDNLSSAISAAGDYAIIDFAAGEYATGFMFIDKPVLLLGASGCEKTHIKMRYGYLGLRAGNSVLDNLVITGKSGYSSALVSIAPADSSAKFKMVNCAVLEKRGYNGRAVAVFNGNLWAVHNTLVVDDGQNSSALYINTRRATLLAQNNIIWAGGTTPQAAIYVEDGTAFTGTWVRSQWSYYGLYGRSFGINPSIQVQLENRLENAITAGKITIEGAYHHIGRGWYVDLTDDGHLAEENSDIVNEGAVLSEPLHDFDGVARDSAPDIGADEWNNGCCFAKGLPDSDCDGMDDQWEIDNGLNPNDPADANFNPDGDYNNGVENTNLQEYLAGTDPNDYYNATEHQLVYVSGDKQKVGFQQTSALPYIYLVLDDQGTPLPNAPITISLPGADYGSLSTSPSGGGSHILNMRTDANGYAEFYYTAPAQRPAVLVNCD